MIRGSVATAFVLQCVGVVRVYDLVVAMTGGGPGISTNMPAVYVIQMITSSQNVGLGMAAAMMMLAPVVAVLALVGIGRWVQSAAQGRVNPQGARSSMTSTTATLPAGTEVAAGPEAAARVAGAPRRLRLPDHLGAVLPVPALRHDRDVAEDDARDPPRPPVQPAADMDGPAVDRCVAARLHRALDCNGLHPGLPELGQDHRAERDRLDRHRLDQRLRAVVLALQGRQHLLPAARVRRLRALPGGHLSADHRAARGRTCSPPCPASSSSTPSSACRS